MTIMVERPGSASGAIDTGRRMARCFPMPAEQEFVGLVTTLVTRFFAQNGRDLTAVEGEPLAGRLSALIIEEFEQCHFQGLASRRKRAAFIMNSRPSREGLLCPDCSSKFTIPPRLCST